MSENSNKEKDTATAESTQAAAATSTETHTESSVETATAHTTSTGGAAVASPAQPKALLYIIALVVVAVIILGALFMMEKEGRSSTTIFSSIIEKQQANAAAAVVNGEEITDGQLQDSIEQFVQMAAMQGADPTDSAVQAEIRNQALEILVNTALLRQAAAEEGVEVSGEEIAARREEIVTQMGGEEALAARIAELGLDAERLEKDIADELVIQRLLETVLLTEGQDITEEEIQLVYDQAGGEEAGLPPLEEVRDQVEAQIATTREQEAIDTYITELRDGAEIEILGI
jgi:FKBP-type peptidyl-prolyl cis-trans isomerase (trigger factor)